MPRLIDAKVLRTCFTEISFDSLSSDELSIILKFYDAIDNAPTIDAEPVRHGKYGFVGMDMMAGSRAFYFGTCSECHERINFEAKHKNYCPNCGAKMDLEEAG